MITTLRRLITFILIVTAPLWISASLWRLRAPLPLKLSLVDYTVPYDNYAEHSASIWAFNHLKLIPPPPQTNALSEKDNGISKLRSSLKLKPLEEDNAPKRKITWESGTSYTGPEPFKPYIQKRLHHTYPLNTISDSKALPYDLIYIADTYGVYREDFVAQIDQGDGKVEEISSSTDPEMLKLLFDQGEIEVHMDYSKLIFGGLSKEDLEVIERHCDRGGDVFFEFNAFCDPTKPEIRSRAEALVGLKWTGWSGRFLPNPQDKQDAPHWLERQYKSQFPEKELTSKASLLLAHRDGRVYLIESDQEMMDVIPTLHVTSQYRERFPMANSPYYYFWFAIMTPDPEVKPKVLAEIELHAPESQKEIFKLLEIPQRIPLLTEHIVGESHRYHFSIDGSDIREDLGNYHYAGLALLNSISPKNRGISVNQRKVFWQFYLPMLNVLLWERSEDRYQDFPPPLWQRILEIGKDLF